MNSPVLIAVAFFAGLGGGWLSKSMWESFKQNYNIVITSTDEIQGIVDRSEVAATDSLLETQSESSQPSPSNLGDLNELDSLPQALQQSTSDTTDTATATFKKLLKERQYTEAIALFQERKQQSDRSAALLKVSLLKELELLTEVRNSSDFSELVQSYLSIYYDDLDVLLLLAEFNQANGSYLEAVNVFLLASTYAFSSLDQENVDNRFKKFVLETDNLYTGQQDWWSLISFYAHIEASGLMTPTFEYQQALAHLRSGDEAFAIAQFNQLLDDNEVGELARQALSSLTDTTEAPTIVYSDPFDGADLIALERLGNQFAVDLLNSRQDSVKLLIDTGASMTAVSTSSFNTLNASGDAVEQERRVFRTANGLIQGTVFLVPELILGAQRLQNAQIAVIDFDNNRGIDGLLGMNILGQFRFHIDQEKSQLLLGKK